MRSYLQRLHRPVACGCVALVLCLSPSGEANVEEGLSAVPYLYLAAQGLVPNGLSSGEASVSWALREDAVVRPIVGAGSAEYADLCAISSGGPDFPVGTRVGWSLEGKLISADVDSARVALKWSRHVLDPSVTDATDFVREFEARLQEGTRSTIDLLRPRAMTGNCDGVVVTMWLEFQDPPELARAVLDYDVWLVHRDATGREVLERSRGRTLHGESLDYLFPRLRYTADGILSPDGAVTADYSGSVRGRLRPDGRIDLALYAHRMLVERSLGQGDGGNTRATMSNGETLEFQMPSPVNRTGGFEAQRTSIRVTVRRVT